MIDRPASWRMPTHKQMEKLASKPNSLPEPPIPMPDPADDLPEAYWESIIRDPRGTNPNRHPYSTAAPI
jgi:hypothetical protein